MIAYQQAIEIILERVGPGEPHEPAWVTWLAGQTLAEPLRTGDGQEIAPAGAILTAARMAAARLAGVNSLPLFPRPAMTALVAVAAAGPGDADADRARPSPAGELLFSRSALSGGVGCPPEQIADLAVRSARSNDLVVAVSDRLTGEEIVRVGGRIWFDGVAVQPGGESMLLACLGTEGGAVRAHLLLTLPDDPAGVLVGWAMLGTVIVNRLMGRPVERCRPPVVLAMSDGELPGVDERMTFVPAVLRAVEKFTAWRVEPLGPFRGDASDAARLAQANALIVRPPGAGPLAARAVCDVVPLDPSLGELA